MTSYTKMLSYKSLMPKMPILLQQLYTYIQILTFLHRMEIYVTCKRNLAIWYHLGHSSPCILYKFKAWIIHDSYLDVCRHIASYSMAINRLEPIILLITLIYMFILTYLCLPGVDLEKGQSCPIDSVFHPLQKILVNLYALIPLLSTIFALAHGTICILW